MFPYEQLRAIADSDDFITHDGLMERLAGQANVRYYKRDFVLRSGNWRGSRVRSALASALFEGFTTIVVGHSDFSFSPWVWTQLRIAGVRRALACNTSTASQSVQPLPLGLTNDCDDGPLHRLLGDRGPLRRVIVEGREPVPYMGAMYANFNLATHPSRRRLHDLLKGLPTSAVSAPDYTPAGRVAYLRSLRDSDFVLCPRGNGLDTHRVWEALYVGGLPVVENFPRARELFSGLPVLIITDWSMIANRDFMRNAWEEIHSTIHHSERITQTFYESRAIQMAGSLHGSKEI